MPRASLKLRTITMITLLCFCILAIAPVNTMAQAAPKIPHTASAFVQGTDGAGNAFSGLLKITQFVTQGNQLFAQGVVNGTLTRADGSTAAIVNQPVLAPVSSVDPSCQILNLVLGPLDLDVLGLTIHLNTVVLNITAVSGNGNLLGNLLCAVANLLNGGGPLSNLLTQLQTLLNQILASL